MTDRSTRRRLAALAGTALVLCAAGCELDRASVGPGEGPMVVHAVLDPGHFEYDVLVEETLTGRVAVVDSFARDTIDPIVAGGGVPVTGAQVLLADDAGHTAVGREVVTRRTDGRGRGVYHFKNQLPPFADPASCPECLPIARSHQYTMRVTAGSRFATGETQIPTPGTGAPQTQVHNPFDRTRDSIIIRLPSGGESARYLFHVGTPYGSLNIFSDSTRITVPGSLVNFAAEDFPPAFVPGFRQTVSVSAVDLNYFDYYRSFNSPFSGAGLINHLHGATGVFGSVFFITTQRIDVTAPYVDPIDGRYVGGESGRDTLQIWLGARVNDGRLLSGSLRRVLPNDLGVLRTGVLGASTSAGLRLDVLNAEIAGDVAKTYTATVAGGVLTAVRGSETLVFRRIAG